jgi:hypothetical protein
VVFWVMTLLSDVVGYQRLGGPCCLHFQGEMASETFVSYDITTRCHNTEDHDINLHRSENFKSRIKGSNQTHGIGS